MKLSSVLTFLKKDNFRYLHIAIIVSAIGCLFIAYLVEFIMHIKPCTLCIYQRFPYLYLIKLSATALLLKKYTKKILIAIMITLMISILLAGYHAGIERKIFEMSSLCSNKVHIPMNLNIQDIKNIISDTPVSSCADISFKVFGLSMSEYNLLFNLFMLTLILIILLVN